MMTSRGVATREQFDQARTSYDAAKARVTSLVKQVDAQRSAVALARWRDWRVLGQATPPEAIQLPAGAMAALQQQGMVAAVAGPLFDAYLIPFEITSLLLLAAIVGAVVLAKRKL